MIRAAVLRRTEPGIAGFTLLEMLIALSILALTAAVTIPAIDRPNDRLILTSAARRMSAAMRLTRARAIGDNHTIAFLIDVVRRTYGSQAFAPQTLPSGVSVRMTFAKSMRRDRAVGGFRFFPDGESSGGEVVLRLHGKSARIAVNWLTGEAEVE
ncbi:MAG TPA: GspH/FimT family pseudopilin [Beijerinckiaceae bacterium]|nr:GspH/FimT family pseudopilin [Beijerinckiaceae bacterium]HVB88784.1 GspH/FimT family pseudopilin [Beijerinckiaceae bacterium]